jgi:hypothetical protein
MNFSWIFELRHRILIWKKVKAVTKPHPAIIFLLKHGICIVPSSQLSAHLFTFFRYNGAITWICNLEQTCHSQCRSSLQSLQSLSPSHSKRPVMHLPFAHEYWSLLHPTANMRAFKEICYVTLIILLLQIFDESGKDAKWTANNMLQNLSQYKRKLTQSWMNCIL